MTAVAETVIGRYITRRLRGSAPLMALVTQVYHREAPPGAQYPFIVYGAAGVNRAMTLGFGGYHVGVEGLYSVQCYCLGTSLEPIEGAAALIDPLLHLGPMEVADETADGVVYSCIREQTGELGGESDGAVWSSLGQTYRVIARAN